MIREAVFASAPAGVFFFSARPLPLIFTITEFVFSTLISLTQPAASFLVSSRPNSCTIDEYFVASKNGYQNQRNSPQPCAYHVTGIDRRAVDKCMSDSGGVDSDAPNTILEAELTEKVGYPTFLSKTNRDRGPVILTLTLSQNPDPPFPIPIFDPICQL